jgi:hypothetical protein
MGINSDRETRTAMDRCHAEKLVVINVFDSQAADDHAKT